MSKRYYLVNVFTDRPWTGNPLAVFPEAADLTGVEMQKIAHELNLSETTFVTASDRADCDFRVRIFTPRTELPMAGHPTLGTARVLRELGRWTNDLVVFEEGVGPVPVRAEAAGWLTMEQPLPQFGPVFELPERIAPLVGLTATDLDLRTPGVPGLSGQPGDLRAEGQIVSCGVPFLFLPVRDRATLDRAVINLPLHDEARQSLKFAGIYLWCPDEQPGVFHARMLAPALGVPEDPATGSAAGPLVCYFLRQGVLELSNGTASCLIHQGEALGRPSQLRAQAWFGRSFERVTVSGQTVMVGEGRLY